MFVSQSEIAIAPDASDALEAAFRTRSRLVDRHAGFLGLELLRDVRRPGHYVLLTRWRDEQSFRAYLKSGDFKASHQRQHDGVHEPKGGAPLRQFERVELTEMRPTE